MACSCLWLQTIFSAPVYNAKSMKREEFSQLPIWTDKRQLPQCLEYPNLKHFHSNKPMLLKHLSIFPIFILGIQLLLPKAITAMWLWVYGAMCNYERRGMRSYHSNRIFFSLPGQGFRGSVVCHRRSGLLSVQRSWEELRRTTWLYRISLRRFRCWITYIHGWKWITRFGELVLPLCINGIEIFLSAVNNFSWCLLWTELRATGKPLYTRTREFNFHATLREVAIAQSHPCHSVKHGILQAGLSRSETLVCQTSAWIFWYFMSEKRFLQCIWHLTSVSRDSKSLWHNSV